MTDDGIIGDLLRCCPRLLHLELDFEDSDAVNANHVASTILSGQPLSRLNSLSILGIADFVPTSVSFAVLFPTLESLHLKYVGLNCENFLLQIYPSSIICPNLRKVTFIATCSYLGLTTDYDPLHQLYRFFGSSQHFPNVECCHTNVALKDLDELEAWNIRRQGEQGAALPYLSVYEIVKEDFRAAVAGARPSIDFSLSCPEGGVQGNRIKEVYLKDGQVRVKWW